MFNCLHSQAPREDELLRYALEGNPLSQPAEAHMVKCNSCRQQLENLMSINSSLLHALYRSRCPDINVLARYSANLASLSEGLLVLYHLSSCPLCAHELEEMQKILEDEIL